jgi:TAT (twin-arginine translocation) pathway-exported protein/high potential iron-sulfur protein
MSDHPTDIGWQFSRRTFLRTAAVGGAAAALGTVITSPAHAAGKMAQKAVNYQPTPKGDLRCDNCALWQAPGSCKLVDGTIAASGWCVLYKKK